MADGWLNIDSGNTNGGHNIATSANATNDTALLTITNSDTAFDQPILVLDANTNGAYDAMDIAYDGTANALHITTGNAAGEGLYFNVAASHTANLITANMGAWLGTADQGIIDIRSDSGAVAEAGHAIYVKLQGTTADAAAISGKALYAYDAGGTQAGSYLVHLESTNNDAMYVAKGHVKVANAEQVKFGTGNELAISNDGSQSYLTLTTDPLWVGAAATNYAAFATNGALTFAGTARPTRTHWFPSTVFRSHSGGAEALVGAGTDKAHSWALDKDTDEAIVTSWRVPDGFDAAADCTYEIYWCANDTNQTVVRWDVICDPLAENEDIDADNEITDTVEDTEVSATAWDLNVTAATTIGSAAEWAADDFVTLIVNRDATHANDTLNVDANFLGILLTYRTTTVG